MANWEKYADDKAKSLGGFEKKEEIIKEAVSEVKDEDGKIVRQAVEEKKESYISLVQKKWDSESGEALPDQERQYSLSELESEKARYDAECARAKAQSDGLKAAIADYKKL